MPKATVTIDLPDGWELAEPEVRCPMKGETFLDNDGRVQTASINYEKVKFPIVRRIADQYVNVRLRRDDAEAYAAMQWPDKINSRLTAACREALRERCPGYYHKGEAAGVGCQRGFDYQEYCHQDGTTDFPCTLPAGHAGSHGV